MGINEGGQTEQVTMLTIRIAPELKAAARKKAEGVGLDLSSVIRGVLRFYATGGELSEDIMAEVRNEFRGYAGERPLPRVEPGEYKPQHFADTGALPDPGV